MIVPLITGFIYTSHEKEAATPKFSTENLFWKTSSLVEYL